MPAYRLRARWRSLGAPLFFFANTFVLATVAVVAAAAAGAGVSRNALTAAAFAWDEGPFLLASAYIYAMGRVEPSWCMLTLKL